jgi:hypothetical protein
MIVEVVLVAISAVFPFLVGKMQQSIDDEDDDDDDDEKQSYSTVQYCTTMHPSETCPATVRVGRIV